MRITHALAAAALTVGVAAGVPAAQAAPVEAPVAHSQQASHPASASKASKTSKARTKASVSGPTTVEVGDDIVLKGTLTRRSGSTSKAYAKATLELVLLDSPDAETGRVVADTKSDKKGKVTFTLPTDAELAGQSFSFLVAYEGGSKARASESEVITVTVTE